MVGIRRADTGSTWRIGMWWAFDRVCNFLCPHLDTINIIRCQVRASADVSYSMHSYVLSKFILDITDIGVGRHREEIRTYNQYL